MNLNFQTASPWNLWCLFGGSSDQYHTLTSLQTLNYWISQMFSDYPKDPENSLFWLTLSPSLPRFEVSTFSSATTSSAHHRSGATPDTNADCQHILGYWSQRVGSPASPKNNIFSHFPSVVWSSCRCVLFALVSRYPPPQFLLQP